MRRTTRTTRTTSAQATYRPDLYGGTYWGAAAAAGISPDIIANRNAFAREWRLRNQSHALYLPGIYWPNGFDHAELYQDAFGAFVLVCSNYGGTPPPPALGMHPVPPIYSIGATTYAVRVATLKELRAITKCMEVRT